LCQLTDEELIQRAFQVSKIFISYKLVLISIETDNLEHATTAFQRINSSSTRMSHVDMVAVLSWSEFVDLKEKILEVQEKLIDVGWEMLNRFFIKSSSHIRGGKPTAKARRANPRRKPTNY
jgi:hypothetical protein